MFGVKSDSKLPDCLVDSFRNLHNGKLRQVVGRGSLGGSISENSRAHASSTAHRNDVPLVDYLHEQHGVNGPHLRAIIIEFWAEAVQQSSHGPFRIRDELEFVSDRSDVWIVGTHAIRRLYDSSQRHCGIIYQGLSREGPIEDLKYWEFVAISRRQDSQDIAPLYRTDGEIKIFDESEFPLTGSRGAVTNLLVICWSSEVAKRISIAQIHTQAWEQAKPGRKHVRLA